MHVNWFLILAFLVALILTVFVLVVITPTNKDGKLNKFFQAIHNFFNFKKMYITLLIKAVTIFVTTLSIIVGVRLLFGIRYYNYNLNTFWIGLLLIVVVPIVIRLSYELLWLAISSMQAVIQIRDKMYDKKDNRFDNDFDQELNSAEDFGNKVYQSAKKFSSEAVDAAKDKLNEMKENKEAKSENNENTTVVTEETKTENTVEEKSEDKTEEEKNN